MPKLKLEGWKFAIIGEALRDRYRKELLEYYEILRKALDEDFDFTKETSADFGIFEEKRIAALEKHQRLFDILTAKISLFEAEHRGTTLSSDEHIEFNNMQAQQQTEEDIIASIWDKFNRLGTIKNIAIAAEGKIDETDFFKTYDDDFSSPPDNNDDNSPPNWNWGD